MTGINFKIKQLVEEKSKGNVKKFAEAIGLGQQRINRLFSPDKRNGKYPSVNFEIIQAILQAFPEVDKQWLTDGDIPVTQTSNAIPIGKSFNDPSEFELIKKIDSTEFRYLDEEAYMIVCPHVTEYAYAGFVSGYADPVYLEELPRHWIIVTELKLGAYMSFTVKGDSMDNGKKGCYSDGDVITTKMLQFKYWDSQLHLHRHNRFVIVTDEGIAIKEIIKHDVENGILICHSLNEDKDTYPDYEQKLSEVKSLYYVVKNSEK